MESSDIIGLLIGFGALAAMVGTLADVYFHPSRYDWLELPRQDSTLLPVKVTAFSARSPQRRTAPWPYGQSRSNRIVI